MRGGKGGSATGAGEEEGGLVGGEEGGWAGGGGTGQDKPGVACSRGRRHCTQGPRWHFSATGSWWLSGSLYTGYLPVC